MYCKLFENYISFKIGKPRPLHAILQITKKCNHKCKYCTIWKSTTKEELSTERILELIKDISKTGVCYLSITGGEPLLRNDVFKIAQEIKKFGIQSILNSNGTLITNKEIAEKITAHFDCINISLDGTEKIHDSICRIKGAYKKALKGIKLLKNIKSKSRIGIYTVVSEKNVNDIEKLIKNIRSEVDFIMLQPEYNRFTKRTYYNQKFIEKWLKLSKKGLVNNSKFYIKGCSRKIKVCDAGKLFFQIDPYGNVYSCPTKIQKLGNVNEGTLKEILNEKSINKNDCECYFQCTAGISYVFRASLFRIIADIKNLIKNN